MDLPLLIGIAVALLAILLTALYFGRKSDSATSPGKSVQIGVMRA